MSLEWETRVTGGANKYDGHPGDQGGGGGQPMEPMELYEQTYIIDEQVGWGVVEIITGA